MKQHCAINLAGAMPNQHTDKLANHWENGTHYLLLDCTVIADEFIALSSCNS